MGCPKSEMVGLVLSLRKKWPRCVLLIPLGLFVKVCLSYEFSLNCEVTQMQVWYSQKWDSRAEEGAASGDPFTHFLGWLGFVSKTGLCAHNPTSKVWGSLGVWELHGSYYKQVPSLGIWPLPATWAELWGRKFWPEMRDEHKVNSVILGLWLCYIWEHHREKNPFHLFSAKSKEFEEPWPVQLWDYKPGGLQGQHLWAAPADHIPGWVWSGGQRGTRLRRWWWW